MKKFAVTVILQLIHDNTMKVKINKLRHKAEIPLAIFYMVVATALLFVAAHIATKSTLDEELMESLLVVMEADTIYAVFLARFGVPIILSYLIFISLQIIYTKKKETGEAAAHDVEVCESQFPELAVACADYSQKLKLKITPKVYITKNADTSILFSKEIFNDSAIRIFADYVTSALDVKRDLTVPKFIIAQFVARIYLKQNNTMLQTATFIAKFIPVVGTIYERAMTYSTDRVVQSLLGTEQTVEAILRLSSEAWFYDYANREIDLKNKLKMKDARTKRELFLVNLISKAPLPAYRIEALYNPKKSGKLF